MKSGSSSKRPPAEIDDYYYLETVEQLQVLADPLRYRIVTLLSTPKTGAQLARELELPRAKVHYHLKLLEGARLIRLHGTGQSSGITEKFYVVVARMLSFERLIPSPANAAVGEVTLASFRAIADFLSAMLEVSRESLRYTPPDLRRREGLWMDFAGEVPQARYAQLRDRLDELRNDVIAMARETAATSEKADLRRFHLTLFLTPQTPEAEESPAPSRRKQGAARRRDSE